MLPEMSKVTFQIYSHGQIRVDIYFIVIDNILSEEGFIDNI